MTLQRHPGNQAVQHMLLEESPQPMLTVGRSGDQFEQEAERVAEQVLRMPASGAAPAEVVHDRGRPAPDFQACPGGCEDEQACHPSDGEKTPERTAASEPSGGLPLGPRAYLDPVFGSAGEPLPDTVRTFFEPRFSRDFGGVRIHRDPPSAAAAGALNAQAFTMGRDIYFGPRQYEPHNEAGRRLLAHELTHVLQQGASPRVQRPEPSEDSLSIGPSVTQTTAGSVVQRACGPPAIGTPVGCASSVEEPVGHRALFRLGCDEFASPADQQQVEDFADSMLASDQVRVHGFASTDGDPTFNQDLSCARALRAATVLQAKNISAGQITLLAHGETPGPAPERRSVVLELAAGVDRPIVPQLSVASAAGPTPGICGGMNVDIQWSISRDSAANGGFVVQLINETWNVKDCNGANVVNPDLRVSPLTFFEAWRVAPSSQVFSPIDTDTWFWPDALPWAGGCTDGDVAVTGTARYYDDVAALPAHMVVNNPATFAGGLQSSLADPALQGNASREVVRTLDFHWTCCPCSSSPTVLDGYAG